jgi:hypothetical protein
VTQVVVNYDAKERNDAAGLSGNNPSGRRHLALRLCHGSLIWNDQTALRRFAPESQMS